jgi:glutamate carboxypeptidase
VFPFLLPSAGGVGVPWGIGEGNPYPPQEGFNQPLSFPTKEGNRPIRFWAIQALADREAGTTVSVGRVAGGTATNVVPARASLQVDVRAWTEAEASRVAVALARLQPVLPGAGDGQRWVEPAAVGTQRPTGALFRACPVDWTDGRVGTGRGGTGGQRRQLHWRAGGADAGWVGRAGEGAHADHEQIQVDAIAGRTALLTAIWAQL